MNGKKNAGKSLRRTAMMLPFYVWLIMFIVLPLVLILVYSFSGAKNNSLIFSLADFTLDHYKKLFGATTGSADNITILLRSLKLALYATGVCLILAYPLALILADEKHRDNPVWFMVFIAPMWMNFLIRILAWRSILDDSGIINLFLTSMGRKPISFLGGDGAIVTGMVYDLLPFMLFPLYTTISKIPQHIIEASRDLGANSFGTLYRVIIPLSVPGIVSGITMVFVPSVTTFVFTQYLANGKGMLIGDLIEEAFKKGSWGFGAAVSMLAMVVIIVCMWLVNRLDDNSEGGNIAW